jgi:hypothetical protein
MTDQDKDSERAKFEAWAIDYWGSHAWRHTSRTCGEWEAWQVARASLAPQSTQGAVPADDWGAKDSARLDWLMHRLSGKELRRLGLTTSSGGPLWTRVAIDAAMLSTGSGTK